MNKSPATLAILVTGALVVGLIVVRAVTQDVTIDEAFTYLLYLDPTSPLRSLPDANNHVLNTLLARASIGTFGLSEITLRLPVVFGGIAYVTFAGLLATLLFGTSYNAPLLFGLLVLNPFLLDLFVAARGYGLALACQLGALLLIADDVVTGRRRLLAVSILCGLGVCANFSFTITLAVTLALYFLWIHPPSAKTLQAWRPALVDALKLALPATLIVVVIAGQLMFNLPRKQLYFGTLSPVQSLHSVLSLVFPPPNGLLFPASLSPALAPLASIGPWLVAAMLGLSPLLLLRSPRSPRDTFAILCGGILIATCAGHFALLPLGIKLPLTRAATYLIPLVTIVIAVAAARLSYAGSAVLVVLVLSFVAAIRTSYFAEWRYNAGIKDAVVTAGNYAKAKHIDEVGVSGGEVIAGNFYRKLFGYQLKPLGPTVESKPALDIYIAGNGSSLAGGLEPPTFRLLYRNSVSGLSVFVRNGR